MRTKLKTFEAHNANKQVYKIEHWNDPNLATFELRTDSGEVVEYLTKGKYRILRTMEDLKSSDPDAP